MLRAYDSIDIAWNQLKIYLGETFDPRLREFGAACEYSEREAERLGQAFYGSSHAYLYELTHFHFSGFKDALFELVLCYAADHGVKRFADIGCGVGLDGQALLKQGFDVDFFDLGGPANEYLVWRLERELGVQARVRPIGSSDPSSYDLVYMADVVEHAEDPVRLVRWAAARAASVALNLFPHDRCARNGFEIHYPLDHEAIHDALDPTHKLMRCAVCGDTVAQIWKRR